MRANYGLSHAYMISLWRSGRNGRLMGAGRLCQREIAHQVYCEPLPSFRASTVGLPSRSARFITSSSSTSRGRQAEKAQKYPLRLHERPPWASKALPAGSEDVTDNTSSSRSLLSSAADEREMKNSSLKLVSKLHLRSPQTQSPHCLSSGWTRAVGGRWSPQFSREKGQTRAELFPKKKAHNERTPFPREQNTRALHPTHKSCVSSGVRNADTDRHTS